MDDGVSSDDLAEARRRGQELQAALPRPQRTTRELVRAEVWMLLVVPFGVLWFLALRSPSSLSLGFAVFVTLLDGSVTWWRIKGGLNRGTRTS